MASQDQVEPLSGQQLQAYQNKMADKLNNILKDVELRKWSVDQACGIAGAQIEADATLIPVDVVKLARSIHSFLTEAAKSESQLRSGSD